MSERETIAKWMIANSLATGHGDTVDDLLAEAAWQIGEMREAIATQNGVVVSSTLKLNEARARVAKLETALLDCKQYAEDHDDEWVPFRVDDALKDTPQ